MELTKTKVRFPDGTKEFEAYINEEERWNGWVCPWFKLDTALEVIDEANELCGFEVIEKRYETGKLFIKDTENSKSFEEVDMMMAEGTMLFAVGNGSWTYVLA